MRGLFLGGRQVLRCLYSALEIDIAVVWVLMMLSMELVAAEEVVAAAVDLLIFERLSSVLD